VTNRALASALSATSPAPPCHWLQIPRDRSTVYRIYSSREEAQADRGPESPAILGMSASFCWIARTDTQYGYKNVY
jgi:hypothetical protein